MRKCLSPLAQIVVVCCLQPAPGFAATGDSTESQSVAGPVTISYESDIASRYLWHGLEFSSGAVSQSSLMLSKGIFTASIWGNYDFTPTPDAPSLNEIDYSVGAEWTFGKFDFESGILRYTYPDQLEAEPTTELSGTVTYSLGVVSPFATATTDLDQYRGATFTEFGFSFETGVGRLGTADATLELGHGTAKFNEAYVGISHSAFQLLSGEIGLNWEISSHLTVRPHFSYTRTIDADIRALTNRANQYLVGLSLAGTL